MNDIDFTTDMISNYFAGVGLRPADLEEEVRARFGFGRRAAAINAWGSTHRLPRTVRVDRCR